MAVKECQRSDTTEGTPSDRLENGIYATCYCHEIRQTNDFPPYVSSRKWKERGALTRSGTTFKTKS